MKKQFRLSLKEISLIIVFLLSLLIIIILAILKQYPDICESYVVNFSSKIVSFISYITNLFSFSLTEICILFFIIVAITSFVLFIVFMVKKHYRSAIHIISSFICFALIIGDSYMLLTYLNYNRQPINLPLYEQEVSVDKFNDISNYFINDFNYCSSQLDYDSNGMLILPYSFEELNNLLIKEYERLDNNPYFSSFTPNCKPLISSYIFSQFHIAGISFSLTGEANINMLSVPYDFGFTMAHELAHLKGVMREEDANLTALYICMFSDNVYLRYSAYIRTISSLLMLLNYTNIKDNYINSYNMISDNIKMDIKASSDYLNSFSLLGDIGDFFNNIYLKLFGNGGTNAYIDNPIIVDTGNKDEGGNIVYDINFSPYQKMYFYKYFNR